MLACAWINRSPANMMAPLTMSATAATYGEEKRLRSGLCRTNPTSPAGMVPRMTIHASRSSASVLVILPRCTLLTSARTTSIHSSLK